MTQTAAALPDGAALRANIPDLTSLPRPELLALQSRAVVMRREADMLLARVAAEIARRSEPADGMPGLARREGHQSPQALVAAASGSSQAEANRLMRVGQVLARDAQSREVDPVAAPGRCTSEPLEPQFPFLASTLRAGRLSVDAGALLADALARTADALDSRALAQWEREVVSKAVGLPLTKVRRLIAFAEARVRPADLARKEDRQYAERSATLRVEPDGMVTLTARLDPVSAAPVRTMIDAYVRDAFQRRRDSQHTSHADTSAAASASQSTASSGPAPSSPASSGPAGDATAPQLRADAVVWLARHAQGCDSGHDGVKTTVVVRMTLDDLRGNDGLAEIDGSETPVSITAARQMAADAEVIPAVLGTDGEVLDWGRRRRLFTQAQRLALVERDGGCARCHAPPSWCEAHHIAWWERDSGPTDLSNGVLLCVRCHHDVHRDGWGIEVRRQRVWFIPPRHIDATREPILGGRARIDTARSSPSETNAA
ncbi:HNH endonuclease [Demequina capsici]|uniref:DUF222 domain-containing protein n=1 Tax=Demequina capsici TaxID=3075620 RepID=A0AA96F836_9MICO|nr:DUF222 domain-containing protein [Demequina sp. OYTSA14]WNM24572.1 DUF222 domain-containing protein [Demequina sp. OYTSA14]